MVRRVLVVPVVWEITLLWFEEEESEETPASVILWLLAIMEEWVQGGYVKDASELAHLMVKEVGREPRAGWEGEPVE